MINQSDLREAGWVEETKQYEDGYIPTGAWHLFGWFPVPTVEFPLEGRPPIAKIGGIRVQLVSAEAFNNFMQKTVPLFCDKTD